jgi:hypothetical protein
MKRILTSTLLAVSVTAGSALVVLANDQPDNFGAEVSAIAKSVENVIDGSHGKAVSELAKTHGAEVSAEARANGEAHAAAKGDNGADASDAQGDNGADASEFGRIKAESGAANAD